MNKVVVRSGLPYPRSRASRHCTVRKQGGGCFCCKARLKQKCQRCGEDIELTSCITKYISGWGHTECSQIEHLRGLPSIRSHYNPLDAELVASVMCLASAPEFQERNDANPVTPSPPRKKQRHSDTESLKTSIVTGRRRLNFDAEKSDEFEAPAEQERRILEYNPEVKNEKFEETVEQERILNYTPTEGEVVAINALAGCGKTTTISLLCNKIRRDFPEKSLLYLVFGKKNEKEAKRSMNFPKFNMEIRTTHALIRRYFFGTTNMHNVIHSDSPHEIKEIISVCNLEQDCQNLFPNLERRKRERITNTVASYIRKTVNKFEWSDDETVMEKHVFWRATRGDMEGRSQWKKEVGKHLYVRWALSFFNVIMTRCCQLREGSGSRLHVPHDSYMKVAQLSNFQIDSDVIVIDEAQDMTPCQASLFWRLEQRKGKMIYLFGDRYQQLYKFRGASDSFQQMVEMTKTRMTLTGSFRFGKNIAEYASFVLKMLGGAEMKGLTKNPGDITAVDNEFEENNGLVVLCRTNQGIFEYLYSTFPKRWCSLSGTSMIKKPKTWMLDLERFVRGESGSFRYKSEMFENAEAIREYIDDEGDTELLRYLQLLMFLKEKDMTLEAFSTKILSAYEELDDVPSLNDYGGVVLGTVHKAKGLEFNKVLIYNDFNFDAIREKARSPKKGYCEDANIFYVAVTRAKEKLFLTPDVNHCFLELGQDANPVFSLQRFLEQEQTFEEKWRDFCSSIDPIKNLSSIPMPQETFGKTLGLHSSIDRKLYRQHLRKLRLRYHPDKFFKQFDEERIVSTDIRNQIEEALNVIIRTCNEQSRSSTPSFQSVRWKRERNGRLKKTSKSIKWTRNNKGRLTKI